MLVYSLCKHEYLGYLIEPHIVQLNSQGGLSLTHQRVFSITSSQFSNFLDEADLAIIKILDHSEQEYLIRQYSQKPIRPTVFFKEIFDKKIYALFRPRLDEMIDQVLPLLANKHIYEMGKDGNPTAKKLELAEKASSILFHFRRNEEGTRYFPTIKYLGKRIEFMFKQAEVICEKPAWMLLENVLYYFEGRLDGKKIIPFLSKRFIEIPRSSESVYFKKFILPLIEKYPVYAEGFDINTIHPKGRAVLKINVAAYGPLHASLQFYYGGYAFSPGHGGALSVHLQESNDQFTFIRIQRSQAWETEKTLDLVQLGLKKYDSSFFSVQERQGLDEGAESGNILFWINSNFRRLESLGFEIEQGPAEKKFFIGHQEISLDFQEKGDWFDILGVVQFGPYRIPFLSLKDHILNKIKEFVLPSGEIALIPDQWFFDLGSLFSLAEGTHTLQVKKIFAGLLHGYKENSMAQMGMNEKLTQMLEFEMIESVAAPHGLSGVLRDYQKAGFDWFCFLKDNHFGGCLADDMGLGKTFQTLALLQKIKEEAAIGSPSSLIIVPTSLIHNWLSECARFTPDLTVYVHTGADRKKAGGEIPPCDLILTTYGITRIDHALLGGLFFNYIILDESQNIKNPQARTSQVVRTLKSNHRLILSGTPLENSLMDLWSQMQFLNPGLLGTQSSFLEDFILPIEKKGDQQRLNRLKSIIKPFILRRTKEQVARELPARTEQVIYSDMTSSQETYYEKIRSYYRTELLKMIDTKGLQKSRIAILQGISQLRQIANHPKMVDQTYMESSGKFNDVLELLENALGEGHKVLIFSSFTKHLALLRAQLVEQKVAFSYLDGSTKNRSEVVNQFREDEAIRVFMISIKAGGVGLNLIEADYVFILDPWWNPAVERQAIDRTHRIGQTKKVFIYKFITKNSVEEKILALQARKLHLTESLISIDPSFTKDLSISDIRAILE